MGAPAPESAAPESAAPESPAPEPPAPESAAPESPAPEPPAPDDRGALDRVGLLHLAVVWLVWGSTFLAIRVAVRGEHGFAPFTLSALRVLSGGALLLAASAVAGGPLLPPRSAIGSLAASGTLLWAAGHAALLYGAARAPSGTAAILFGTTPLFALAGAVLLGRRRLELRLVLPMVTGFLGIAALAVPSLIGPSPGVEATPPTALLALALAPVGWAAGSLVQSGGAPVPALTSAAWQQLFGGSACVVLALARREPWPVVGFETAAAVVYLVVPGCIPAFTSYVRALQLLPTGVVMSFAYVNPPIAVLLGWVLLGERPSPSSFVAITLVALGVAWVLRSERPEPPR